MPNMPIMTSPSIGTQRRLALWSQRHRSVTVVVEKSASDEELFGDCIVQLNGEERDPESGELSYRVLRVAGVEIELYAPVCGLVSCGTGGGDGCQAGHVVTLAKAEHDAPFWPSFAASKDAAAASGFLVRSDWSRWVDEDDDEDVEEGEGGTNRTYDEDGQNEGEITQLLGDMGGDDYDDDDDDDEEDENTADDDDEVVEAEDEAADDEETTDEATTDEEASEEEA